MGSYYIPSNKLKGESRILYIFTGKSLIYTAVGGLIGGIFYMILSAIGMGTIGIIIMAAFALIGFSVATFKIPNVGNTKISKNVGGDNIDEIIKNYFLFTQNKKVYSYALPRKDKKNESDTETKGKTIAGFNVNLGLGERNKGGIR
jgi:hypothetical protein